MLSLRLSKAASGLPISATQLATTVGMRRPISLKALLTATGSRTRRPRILVLRYQWRKAKPPKPQAPIWPDSFLDEVLTRPNGWSLRDYWYRASQGLIDIDIVVEPWRTLEQDQTAKEASDRGKVIQMCKDQAAADKVSLDGFDHIIGFLYPGENNCGAAGGNALFDQSPFSLEFFAHEMGHVLGYSHAFGTNSDYVYQDPWCVMGYSEVQDYVVPSTHTGPKVNNPARFWKQGRRLSTAALFRYDGSTEFGTTPGVVRVDATAGPQTISLVAASESNLYDPTLVVVDADFFQVTVEYRIPTHDDAGIRSKEAVRNAVIVHSIGRRDVLRWQSENKPVWLEAEIPADPALDPTADPKPDAWIEHGWDVDKKPHHIHVELLTVNGPRATLRISRADRP